jgi:SAM-dependent methyltransferase
MAAFATIAAFTRKALDRADDLARDHWYGVDTGGYASTAELGTDARESVHYATMPWRHIRRALGRVPLDERERVLLDYGCGRGRVLVAAAARPYRCVIGIELSRLADDARANLAAMRGRRAQDVRVERGDAGAFVVPDDINLVYFYNPFRGAVLDRVIAQLHASLQRAPRALYVAYFNHDHFDRQLGDAHWLRRRETRMATADTSFALYEASA